MRTKIKMLSLGLLVMILLCIMVSCEKKIMSSDIVILYTNDVHCKIDEKIGYAGLASYKNYVKTKTDYVTLEIVPIASPWIASPQSTKVT